MARLLIPPQGISLDGLTWEGGSEVDMHDQAWCRRLMDAGAIVLSGFEGFNPPSDETTWAGTLAPQQPSRYRRHPA
jgi:hypothetical protein